MTTPSSLPFVLVPGFWLGGWAWERVAAPLAAAGHDVHPLTLPGLDTPATPRHGITLDDHIQAVVEAVARHGPAVLVGHSGAAPVVYGATDRVPDLVRRAVYVESGPLPDGVALQPDLDPTVAELPLPSWAELEASGNSLAGLEEQDLAEFRRRAVPHPAGPARDPLRLSDSRRYDVPVTVIAASIRGDEIRGLVQAGHPFFAELARFDATILDLPTGHWPMWSRPDDLAAQLLRAVS